MKGQFITDQGQVRDHNEDSGGIFYNRSNQLLAIVADGMGGHRAGDVASQMATSFVKEKWQECNALLSPEETKEWLLNTITAMNNAIYEEALNNEACKGMGTTIVITVCTEEFVTVAHIGDSRCYIQNENGFKQLTEDHSLVNELLRTGQISKDDAEQHPRKNVLLKALGTEQQLTADVHSIEWEQDNKLLLCSDGLTNKLSDQDLADFLASNTELQELSQQLVDTANERGGEDNISLILVSHDSSEEEGENSC